MAIDRSIRGQFDPPPELPQGPGKTVYVNAYSVTRHYGGPEEGGWYYDAGRPLGSIPLWIPDDEDDSSNSIDEAKRLLWNQLYWGYVGARDRHSVIGEDDLAIYVEDEFAKGWPDETPHYE